MLENLLGAGRGGSMLLLAKRFTNSENIVKAVEKLVQHITWIENLEEVNALIKSVKHVHYEYCTY